MDSPGGSSSQLVTSMSMMASYGAMSTMNENSRLERSNLLGKRKRCNFRLTSDNWDYLQVALQSISTVISAMVAICWTMFIYPCESELGCVSTTAYHILNAVSSTCFYVATRVVVDRTMDNAARTRLCHRLVEEGIIIEHERTPISGSLIAFLVVGFLSFIAVSLMNLHAPWRQYQSLFVAVASQSFAIIMVLLRVCWFEQSHVSIVEVLAGKRKEDKERDKEKEKEKREENSGSGGGKGLEVNDVEMNLSSSSSSKGGEGGGVEMTKRRSREGSNNDNDNMNNSSNNNRISKEAEEEDDEPENRCDTDFLVGCRVVSEKYVVAAIIDFVLDRCGKLGGFYCSPQFVVDMSEIANRALELQKKKIAPSQVTGFSSQSFWQRRLALTMSPSLLLRKATFSDRVDEQFGTMWRRVTFLVWLGCSIAYTITQLFVFIAPLIKDFQSDE